MPTGGFELFNNLNSSVIIFKYKLVIDNLYVAGFFFYLVKHKLNVINIWYFKLIKYIVNILIYFFNRVLLWVYIIMNIRMIIRLIF